MKNIITSKNIPIFIINLEHNVDNNQHMKTLCKQHDLQCQFIKAVYGKELKKETIEKVYDRSKNIDHIGRELTKGEIGCALSHINIYNYMIDKNIEQAIIFEDDIEIEENFTHILQNIDRLPDDWELVLLGYFSGPMEEEKETKSYSRYRKKLTKNHNLVRLREHAWGSHGYLINLAGAEKLARKTNPITMPIDRYTGSDKYINLYAISPRVIRVHEIFGKKQSSLEADRAQMRDTNTIPKKKKSLIDKLKREILRPFLQFIKFIKNPFRSTVKKYKK